MKQKFVGKSGEVLPSTIELYEMIPLSILCVYTALTIIIRRITIRSPTKDDDNTTISSFFFLEYVQS